VGRRLNSVTISTVLLTACLLMGLPAGVELALTASRPYVEVYPGVEIQNYLADAGFTLLTIISIGLLITWTAYWRRELWAWFALSLLAGLYFFPVHVLRVFMAIAQAEDFRWSDFLLGAIQQPGIVRTSTLALLVFLVMVIALVIPVRAFFKKSSSY